MAAITERRPSPCCSPTGCPETTENVPVLLGQRNDAPTIRVIANVQYGPFDRWCEAWVSGTDVDGDLAGGYISRL